MGLLSGITSNVLIKMKADTSQAKRATKDLAASQKKLSKQTVDGLNKQNAMMGKSLKMWGKIAVGVGSAVVAFKAAKVAFRAFADDAQLRGAAAGISLEKLRKASQGLISDYDLLSQAGALQNTTFKLNQEEMEEVIKFMLILRKQGNDMAEVQARVTKAFVKGKVEALEPFGVVVENVGTKVEKAANLMRAMREENAKFSGSLEIAGDDAKKVGIKLANAFQDAKVALGQLVNSLTPLIEGLAKVATGIALIAKHAFSALSPAEMKKRFRIMNESGFRDNQLVFERMMAQQKAIAAGFAAGPKAAAGTSVTAPRRGGRGGPRTFRDSAATVTRGQGLFGPGSAGPSFGGIDTSIGGPLAGGQAGIDVSRFGIAQQDAAEAQRAAQAATELQRVAAQQTGDQSFLQRHFGQVSEFEGYRSAFEGLTGAIGAGMQALVDGSASVGAAIKQSLAQFAGGEAVRMQIEAVKHLGYALGSVAFLDGRGAAAHFASAAKFQAGAVLALGVARSMGSASGGAQVGGGIPTGAPNVLGSGGGSGGQGRTVNVFVGDDFSRTDSRKRGTQFRRTMRDALQGGGIDSEVSFG